MAGTWNSSRSSDGVMKKSDLPEGVSEMQIKEEPSDVDEYQKVSDAFMLAHGKISAPAKPSTTAPSSSITTKTASEKLASAQVAISTPVPGRVGTVVTSKPSTITSVRPGVSQHQTKSAALPATPKAVPGQSIVRPTVTGGSKVTGPKASEASIGIPKPTVSSGSVNIKPVHANSKGSVTSTQQKGNNVLSKPGAGSLQVVGEGKRGTANVDVKVSISGSSKVMMTPSNQKGNPAATGLHRTVASVAQGNPKITAPATVGQKVVSSSCISSKMSSTLNSVANSNSKVISSSVGTLQVANSPRLVPVSKSTPQKVVAGQNKSQENSNTKEPKEMETATTTKTTGKGRPFQAMSMPPATSSSTRTVSNAKSLLTSAGGTDQLSQHNADNVLAGDKRRQPEKDRFEMEKNSEQDSGAAVSKTSSGDTANSVRYSSNCSDVLVKTEPPDDYSYVAVGGQLHGPIEQTSHVPQNKEQKTVGSQLHINPKDVLVSHSGTAATENVPAAVLSNMKNLPSVSTDLEQAPLVTSVQKTTPSTSVCPANQSAAMLVSKGSSSSSSSINPATAETAKLVSEKGTDSAPHTGIDLSIVKVEPLDKALEDVPTQTNPMTPHPVTSTQQPQQPTVSTPQPPQPVPSVLQPSQPVASTPYLVTSTPHPVTSSQQSPQRVTSTQQPPQPVPSTLQSSRLVHSTAPQPVVSNQQPPHPVASTPQHRKPETTETVQESLCNDSNSRIQLQEIETEKLQQQPNATLLSVCESAFLSTCTSSTATTEIAEASSNLTMLISKSKIVESVEPMLWETHSGDKSSVEISKLRLSTVSGLDEEPPISAASDGSCSLDVNNLQKTTTICGEGGGTAENMEEQIVTEEEVTSNGQVIKHLLCPVDVLSEKKTCSDNRNMSEKANKEQLVAAEKHVVTKEQLLVEVHADTRGIESCSDSNFKDMSTSREYSGHRNADVQGDKYISIFTENERLINDTRAEGKQVTSANMEIAELETQNKAVGVQKNTECCKAFETEGLEYSVTISTFGGIVGVNETERSCTETMIGVQKSASEIHGNGTKRVTKQSTEQKRLFKTTDKANRKKREREMEQLSRDIVKKRPRLSKVNAGKENVDSTDLSSKSNTKILASHASNKKSSNSSSIQHSALEGKDRNLMRKRIGNVFDDLWVETSSFLDEDLRSESGSQGMSIHMEPKDSKHRAVRGAEKEKYSAILTPGKDLLRRVISGRISRREMKLHNRSFGCHAQLPFLSSFAKGSLNDFYFNESLCETEDIAAGQRQDLLSDLNSVYLGKQPRFLMKPMGHLKNPSLELQLESQMIDIPSVKKIFHEVARDWVHSRPLHQLMNGQLRVEPETILAPKRNLITNTTYDNCHKAFSLDICRILADMCNLEESDDSLFALPDGLSQFTANRVFRKVKQYLQKYMERLQKRATHSKEIFRMYLRDEGSFRSKKLRRLRKRRHCLHKHRDSSESEMEEDRCGDGLGRTSHEAFQLRSKEGDEELFEPVQKSFSAAYNLFCKEAEVICQEIGIHNNDVEPEGTEVWESNMDVVDSSKLYSPTKPTDADELQLDAACDSVTMDTGYMNASKEYLETFVLADSRNKEEYLRKTDLSIRTENVPEISISVHNAKKLATENVEYFDQRAKRQATENVEFSVQNAKKPAAEKVEFSVQSATIQGTTENVAFSVQSAKNQATENIEFSVQNAKMQAAENIATENVEFSVQSAKKQATENVEFSVQNSKNQATENVEFSVQNTKKPATEKVEFSFPNTKKRSIEIVEFSKQNTKQQATENAEFCVKNAKKQATENIEFPVLDAKQQASKNEVFVDIAEKQTYENIASENWNDLEGGDPELDREKALVKKLQSVICKKITDDNVKAENQVKQKKRSKSSKEKKAKRKKEKHHSSENVVSEKSKNKKKKKHKYTSDDEKMDTMEFKSQSISEIAFQNLPEAMDAEPPNLPEVMDAELVRSCTASTSDAIYSDSYLSIVEDVFSQTPICNFKENFDPLVAPSHHYCNPYRLTWSVIDYFINRNTDILSKLAGIIPDINTFRTGLLKPQTSFVWSLVLASCDQIASDQETAKNINGKEEITDQAGLYDNMKPPGDDQVEPNSINEDNTKRSSVKGSNPLMQAFRQVVEAKRRLSKENQKPKQPLSVAKLSAELAARRAPPKSAKPLYKPSFESEASVALSLNSESCNSKFQKDGDPTVNLATETLIQFCNDLKAVLKEQDCVDLDECLIATSDQAHIKLSLTNGHIGELSSLVLNMYKNYEELIKISDENDKILASREACFKVVDSDEISSEGSRQEKPALSSGITFGRTLDEPVHTVDVTVDLSTIDIIQVADSASDNSQTDVAMKTASDKSINFLDQEVNFLCLPDLTDIVLPAEADKNKNIQTSSMSEAQDIINTSVSYQHEVSEIEDDKSKDETSELTSASDLQYISSFPLTAASKKKTKGRPQIPRMIFSKLIGPALERLGSTGAVSSPGSQSDSTKQAFSNSPLGTPLSTQPSCVVTSISLPSAAPSVSTGKGSISTVHVNTAPSSSQPLNVLVSGPGTASSLADLTNVSKDSTATLAENKISHREKETSLAATPDLVGINADKDAMQSLATSVKCSVVTVQSSIATVSYSATTMQSTSVVLSTSASIPNSSSSTKQTQMSAGSSTSVGSFPPIPPEKSSAEIPQLGPPPLPPSTSDVLPPPMPPIDSFQIGSTSSVVPDSSTYYQSYFSGMHMASMSQDYNSYSGGYPGFPMSSGDPTQALMSPWMYDPNLQYTAPNQMSMMDPSMMAYPPHLQCDQMPFFPPPTNHPPPFVPPQPSSGHLFPAYASSQPMPPSGLAYMQPSNTFSVPPPLLFPSAGPPPALPPPGLPPSMPPLSVPPPSVYPSAGPLPTNIPPPSAQPYNSFSTQWPQDLTNQSDPFMSSTQYPAISVSSSFPVPSTSLQNTFLQSPFSLDQQTSIQEPISSIRDMVKHPPPLPSQAFVPEFSVQSHITPSSESQMNSQPQSDPTQAFQSHSTVSISDSSQPQDSSLSVGLASKPISNKPLDMNSASSLSQLPHSGVKLKELEKPSSKGGHELQKSDVNDYSSGSDKLNEAFGGSQKKLDMFDSQRKFVSENQAMNIHTNSPNKNNSDSWEAGNRRLRGDWYSQVRPQGSEWAHPGQKPVHLKQQLLEQTGFDMRMPHPSGQQHHDAQQRQTGPLEKQLGSHPAGKQQRQQDAQQKQIGPPEKQLGGHQLRQPGPNVLEQQQLGQRMIHPGVRPPGPSSVDLRQHNPRPRQPGPNDSEQFRPNSHLRHPTMTSPELRQQPLSAGQQLRQSVPNFPDLQHCGPAAVGVQFRHPTKTGPEGKQQTQIGQQCRQSISKVPEQRQPEQLQPAFQLRPPEPNSREQKPLGQQPRLSHPPGVAPPAIGTGMSSKEMTVKPLMDIPLMQRPVDGAASLGVRPSLNSDRTGQSATAEGTFANTRVFVFNTDRDICKTAERFLLRSGLRKFDPYNINILRTMLPIRCLVVVHKEDLRLVQRIPSLLRLKRDLRVNFVTFSDTTDIQQRRFVTFFPRAGTMVMDLSALLSCKSDVLDGICQFMGQQTSEKRTPWKLMVSSNVFRALDFLTFNCEDDPEEHVRLTEVSQILATYKTSGLVEFLPENLFRGQPRTTIEYQACCIALQISRLSAFRHFLFVTDMPRSHPDANLFLNNGIDILSIPEFMHCFAMQKVLHQPKHHPPYITGVTVRLYCDAMISNGVEHLLPPAANASKPQIVDHSAKQSA